jgi:ubiquinone/menaquinone biosynthesis C-methylase UbiE
MDVKAIEEILGDRFRRVATDGAAMLKEVGLPAGAKVLDVGTGQGYFAIFLAAQGYEVLTGEPETDSSRYARRDWAENARKADVLERIRFAGFDASRLPFECEAFDAVFFYGVLHHIDAQQRADVLREAQRVAKRGGVVVFFEPSQKMLEIVRMDDPEHPDAADPFKYAVDGEVEKRLIAGTFMNIFVCRKRNCQA